jgi:hypothetical protein
MTRWIISPRALALSALLTLLIGLAAFQVTTRTTSGFLVWSDGLAYFLYSRALVLEGHSDITEGYETLDKLYPADSKSGSRVMDSIRVNVGRNPNTGRIFTAWPIGAGVVMAPFYALGYVAERVVAAAMGRAPNSFGIIPQYFFGLGSLVFGWLGFWATFLCCRNVARANWAYLASLGIILGGPAVFYIFVNPTMAHAMSFGLVALLTLWWWQQWNEGTEPKRFAVLALLLGVLISIRLQNAVFGVLPAALLLLEVRRSSWYKALVTALCGAATASIPLLVQVLHSSFYGPPKAAALTLQSGGLLMIGNYPLDLKSPYFLDVLFSCRHGALHWAPILALGLIGLAWAGRRDAWPWILLITIFCHVYLIGGLGISDLSGRAATFDSNNWNEHWKGGTSFGMRYLTECTPFFAVGLAGLMQATGRRIATQWWGAVLILFVVWNGMLILAYGLGTVSHTSCVTYPEMAAGVGQALSKLVTAVGR